MMKGNVRQIGATISL